jgi:hypothetical protein
VGQKLSRTDAELHVLLEGGQFAVIIAFLVDLISPWWTQTDPIGQVGTHTGWASIGPDGGYLASAPALAMLIALAVLPFRKPRISWIAAGLIAALTLLAFVNTERDHRIGFGHAHAGAWCGCLLTALAAVLLIANGVLTRRRLAYS